MYIKITDAKLQDFKGKKVIFFGASSTGTKALEEFVNMGADVIGFCDNGQNKWGTLFEGRPVFGPEELKLRIKENPDIPVMITSTYVDEISNQLREMGIADFHTVYMGVLYEYLPFEKFENTILSSQDANKEISEIIDSKEPAFIGRLGSNELETICNYLYFLDRRNTDRPYTNNITNMLCEWAGFFPKDHKNMDRFCELYLEMLPKANLLWCMWQSKYEDKVYKEYCPNTKLSLYEETGFPIKSENPWTKSLSGKKVLVIHPFEDSIRRGYENRKLLFTNPDFMPDFELKTIKAVQTIADNNDYEYASWFEALYSMKKKMSATDYDIALIGAGAYGLPLAAYAKEMGKQGIHVGGMLQLYFGIRGKYYDQFNYHNEYWTRPSEEEKPKGFKKVEAGRYW